MKKQLLIVGLTVLLILVGLSGCITSYENAGIEEITPTFETFISEEGGFSILMPGVPAENITTIVSELYGETIYLYLFSVGLNTTAYMIGYNDYSDDILQNYSSSDILNNSRDGGIINGTGELISEMIISINGYPGREITVSYNQDFNIRNRKYLVENRLYQIAFTQLNDDSLLLSSSTSEFLDSFELI